MLDAPFQNSKRYVQAPLVLTSPSPPAHRETRKEPEPAKSQVAGYMDSSTRKKCQAMHVEAMTFKFGKEHWKINKRK